MKRKIIKFLVTVLFGRKLINCISDFLAFFRSFFIIKYSPIHSLFSYWIFIIHYHIYYSITWRLHFLSSKDQKFVSLLYVFDNNKIFKWKWQEWNGFIADVPVILSLQFSPIMKRFFYLYEDDTWYNKILYFIKFS